MATHHPFDLDAYLAQPLTARVAMAGPRVLPVWFLWEDNAFWIITGPWSRLLLIVREDPKIAICVDTCDLLSGRVRQVLARGTAELVVFDSTRGYRKLSRYLGADVSRWDGRFLRYLNGEDNAQWLRLAPATITARDLSFEPSTRE